MRILVVDDTASVADTLAIILRNDGHDVTVFYHPFHVLRHLQTSGEKFDVIISDRMMPRMNGLILADELLRKYPWTHTSLLIAHTSCDTEAERQQSFEAGYHYHFVKPCSPDELLRVIRVWGEQRKEAA